MHSPGIHEHLHPPRPSYRRLQFSLRGLLMLMLAALTWLGYYADQVHRQQAAVATIEKLGGKPLYLGGMSTGSSFDVKGWLARWLGPNSVDTVRDVHFGGCVLSNNDLACLAGLPHLRTLILTSTPVTDDCLVHMHHLNDLKFVDLRFTRVTPEGVERLRRDLPNAKIVYRSDID